MKLRISYSSGIRHELELAAAVAVIGRDPHCDVVLNDTKCSRRHAILEEDPEGISFRDAGSSNGVYLNGRRLVAGRLGPQDVLRLGDVEIQLVPTVGETVVVAPEDLELAPPVSDAPASSPPPGPPTPPPAPRPAPEPRPPGPDTRPPRSVSAVAGSPRARPLMVTVLAASWAIVSPAACGLVLFAAFRLQASALGWAIACIAALTVTGLGAAMTVGLSSLAPWARHLQIAAAAVGLLCCPLTPASATLLLYFTRPEVARWFERPAAQPARRPEGEAAFVLTLLATLLLGALAATGLVLYFERGGHG